MPPASSVTWRGAAIAADVTQRLVAALTEIDLRIEAEAKAELYPGHGKLTGTMQRAIVGEPARIDGSRVRGRVAVKGVPYAMAMHRRYQYITIGLNRVRPLALDIVRRAKA